MYKLSFSLLPRPSPAARTDPNGYVGSVWERACLITPTQSAKNRLQLLFGGGRPPLFPQIDRSILCVDPSSKLWEIQRGNSLRGFRSCGVDQRSSLTSSKHISIYVSFILRVYSCVSGVGIVYRDRRINFFQRPGGALSHPPVSHEIFFSGVCLMHASTRCENCTAASRTQ